MEGSGGGEGRGVKGGRIGAHGIKHEAFLHRELHRFLIFILGNTNVTVLQISLWLMGLILVIIDLMI